MQKGKAVILNEKGLHLNLAMTLCDYALKYPCKVNIRIREYDVSAKSMLGVLSACIKTGDEVEVICDGEEEQEALADIISLIDNEFYLNEDKTEIKAPGVKSAKAD